MVDNEISANVLVAAEDPTLRGFLTDNLSADGYVTLGAEDLTEAEVALRRGPHLVICDLNGQALALVDRIRGAQAGDFVNPDVGLIVLSRSTEQLDRIRAYDRGADDYIAKPFSYPELVSRARAVLRRAHPAHGQGTVRLGELVIDPAARSVTLQEQPVALTHIEYDLLRALAAEPQRVFTKAELLREVWGFACAGRTRTVDTHACRLRRKLSHAGVKYIANVWGVGYRLV